MQLELDIQTLCRAFKVALYFSLVANLLCLQNSNVLTLATHPCPILLYRVYMLYIVIVLINEQIEYLDNVLD